MATWILGRKEWVRSQITKIVWYFWDLRPDKGGLKLWCIIREVIFYRALSYFYNTTWLYTTGTHNHSFYSSFIKRTYFLKIRLEATFRYIMCVAYIIAHKWFFPAYFTYPWHNYFSWNYIFTKFFIWIFYNKIYWV